MVLAKKTYSQNILSVLKTTEPRRPFMHDTKEKIVLPLRFFFAVIQKFARRIRCGVKKRNPVCLYSETVE